MRAVPASLATALLVLALACGGEEAPAPRAPEVAPDVPSAAEAAAAEAAGLPAAELGAAPTAQLSPSAQPELHQQLLDDLAAARHPSDGGGRAWLEPTDAKLVAGAPARFHLVYEAGPLGIAPGGWLYLQVPPYWGWSTPQVESPVAPGFTRVTTAAAGVVLAPATLAEPLLGIEVSGRALAAGERIEIVYGAGELGARVDRFAERGARFELAVDGDGDGIRAFLADPPSVDVGPGPAARLALFLPSTSHPGVPVALRLAVLDGVGNAGPAFEGPLGLELPEGVEGPARIELAAGDGAFARVRIVPRAAGVVRVTATGPDGLRGESNPMLVAGEAPAVLWADLHGHSNFSDGTGLPDDYFAYARDVAALDAVALTDHDHWGTPFLDAAPERWAEIREAVARFHQPGTFVTLLGYEWTSWLHGHRHVLWFGDEGEIVSSVDPATDDPAELWDALRGSGALTFAHHSAGGPVATNWAFPPDPEMEPVTEIVSVHGSSEAADAPSPIYAAVAGNFVRDVLGRGYRLGFVGSGDSHDGHPGLAQLASPAGAGLAALVGGETTRESVRETLRRRRVYATNGPRILLQVALAGAVMGGVVPPGDASLFVRALTETPLLRIDVVRGADVALAVAAPDEDSRDVAFEAPLEGLRPGEWVYVRVVQRDGGAAWSSPIFVGDPAPRPNPNQ